MEYSHCAQYQNLMSGKHAQNPVRKESLGTMHSQSVGIVFLSGIYHRKAMSNVSILRGRLFSDHKDFAMLSFYLEFHTVLWAFNKQTFSCLCSWT